MQANLVGLPSLVTNRAMRRQPLNIHYLSRHLLKPNDSSFRKFSLFASSKTTSHRDEDTIPDCSFITPEIPTPDGFHDQTGYTFSGVTLGSNPLYNWSVTSNSTSTKEKNGSLDVSFEDVGSSEGEGHQECESILDFRVTSSESGERRACGRPSYLWLPSLKNLEAQGLVQHPPSPVSGVIKREEPSDGSLPSSDCDANCKRQISQADSGLTTGE